MSKVAIQGIQGSYSEEAALTLLGAPELLECRDFTETFDSLEAGRAEYAVVPVENKIVGDIACTISFLRGDRFRILDRAVLQVRHVLAGTADSKLDEIELVSSHVEALKQCRNYLAANPKWTQIIGGDTAGSVRLIVDDGNATNAAIASRRATEMYGAKVLAEDIADDLDNWTTFCLLSR
jgi:prephenate dehydratase